MNRDQKISLFLLGGLTGVYLTIGVKLWVEQVFINAGTQSPALEEKLVQPHGIFRYMSPIHSNQEVICQFWELETMYGVPPRFYRCTNDSFGITTTGIPQI